MVNLFDTFISIVAAFWFTDPIIGWESSTNCDITDQFTGDSPELHTIDDLAAVKNDTLLDRNQTV